MKVENFTRKSSKNTVSIQDSVDYFDNNVSKRDSFK